ncbi:STOREKEEPER protein-like [Gastrolobium bilobum]|uniref:STOREKEEPER protein-like n=1 Tax=Gastrolobium bilobum TaxID=150636 RepID=UPI002AAF2FCA|nr:STOREKEEPER protein-like [Gastrolobium bilobum]
MAQKKQRPSPLDEPPTASSSESEEEDQQPSSRQHEEEVAASSEEEDGEASTEEEDDDEEENHQHPSLQPSAKNPPPPPTNSHPKPSSSESATESDSGTESEPEPNPSAPGAANPKVKPLASKPMEQTPKARSQPSAPPARSGSKRPAADNNMHATDPKRSKKKVTVSALAAVPFDKEVEEDGKKSGDDPKKLFQRIWSEEDEIAILKGMVEFASKTGMDPIKQVNDFHDFVKKSLHVDASVNQLKEKIRRLKKKFETNAGKGKNGEGPKFSKAHEQKSFELSKKVWANGDGGVANGAMEKAKSNGKAAKILKEGTSSIRNAASPKKSKPETNPETNLPSLDSQESEKMDIDIIPDTNLALSEMIRFGKSGSLFGLNENVIKGGLELMEASKREELEVRWNKLQVAELELFAKRTQLIGDQARLILEAYKSSNH